HIQRLPSEVTAATMLVAMSKATTSSIAWTGFSLPPVVPSPRTPCPYCPPVNPSVMLVQTHRVPSVLSTAYVPPEQSYCCTLSINFTFWLVFPSSSSPPKDQYTLFVSIKPSGYSSRI